METNAANLYEEELLETSHAESVRDLERSQADELLDNFEYEPADSSKEKIVEEETEPLDVIKQFGEGDWKKTYDRQITGTFDFEKREQLDLDGKTSITKQIREGDNTEYAAMHERIMSGWVASGGQAELVSYKEETEDGVRLNVTRTWVEADGQVMSETWTKTVKSETESFEEAEEAEVFENSTEPETDNLELIEIPSEPELVLFEQAHEESVVTEIQEEASKERVITIVVEDRDTKEIAENIVISHVEQKSVPELYAIPKAVEQKDNSGIELIIENTQTLENPIILEEIREEKLKDEITIESIREAGPKEEVYSQEQVQELENTGITLAIEASPSSRKEEISEIKNEIVEEIIEKDEERNDFEVENSKINTLSEVREVEAIKEVIPEVQSEEEKEFEEITSEYNNTVEKIQDKKSEIIETNPIEIVKQEETVIDTKEIVKELSQENKIEEVVSIVKEELFTQQESTKESIQEKLEDIQENVILEQKLETKKEADVEVADNEAVYVTEIRSKEIKSEKIQSEVSTTPENFVVTRVMKANEPIIFNQQNAYIERTIVQDNQVEAMTKVRTTESSDNIEMTEGLKETKVEDNFIPVESNEKIIVGQRETRPKEEVMLTEDTKVSLKTSRTQTENVQDSLPMTIRGLRSSKPVNPLESNRRVLKSKPDSVIDEETIETSALEARIPEFELAA